MRTRGIILLVIGGALLVVLGISAFLLVRGIGAFSEAEKKLARQERMLRDYYARNPFPSADNVAREQENARALRGWLEKLDVALMQGQVGPQRKTPSAFMILFGRTRDDLKALAVKQRVTLPEGLAFGFDRYTDSGVVPAPADVPRLAQQLVILDRLCRVLLENGVSSIDRIDREIFEGKSTAADSSAAADRRRRRSPRSASRGAPSAGGGWTWDAHADAGIIKPGERFTSLHFAFEFHAREDALRNVLNGLATEDMFAVVSLLEISKTHDDIKPPAADQVFAPLAAGERPREFPRRRERLMSGPVIDRPLAVRIDVDVYRFAPVEPEAGA